MIERVALVFDDTARPETTGTYCRRALEKLVRVQHFLPTAISHIPENTFDLHLFIDDGMRYPIPQRLQPSAYWAIDSHIDFEWALEQGGRADFVFAAQLEGCRQLTAVGLDSIWLPLACDPDIHRPHPVPKRWDLAFVGNLGDPARREWLNRLRQQFPNTFIGQCYFDEYARTLSEARMGFNRSVRNDLNMRVFETLGCGSLLVTNELRENGQDELFRADEHLVKYRSFEELLDKIRFYLGHETVSERIARAGHEEAANRHTYLHRMEKLLAAVNGRHRRLVAATHEVRSKIDGDPSDWLESVDFVVKTFLRPKALLRLLESIRRFYPLAHVTIADDGGLCTGDDSDSQACCALIAQNKRWTLHSLPFGAGVVTGRNQLIDVTKRPFVLILDDDFIVTEETDLRRLYHRLQQDEAVGVAAGTCMDWVGEARRMRCSGGTLQIDGETLQIDTQGWRDGAQGLRDYVPQFAIIRREVFDRVRWDGALGGEHYDFCLQLQQSGWKVAQDPTVRIDHDHFSPALPGYRERRDDCGAAEQWLLQKWNLQRIVQDGQIILERDAAARNRQFLATDSAELASGAVLPIKDESYFDFSRPEVAALVPLDARRVLDIGCGGGRLGELLKQRQPVEVTGIEMQPTAIQWAQGRLDHVIQGSVEDPALSFRQNQFDCVICADVLEHLREPGLVLDKVLRWLAPDGTLVVSIPNVRHHSVVGSLLEGNWTYEAAGLLDSDHVRFFTRREFEKLLDRHGFEVESIHSIPGPGPEHSQWVQAGCPGEVCLGGLTISPLPSADAEEFLTYQFLFVARPYARRTISASRAMQQLRRDFAWPLSRPDVPIPTENLGWFSDAPRQLLSQILSPQTRLVVELGAWLGLSTRFITQAAPQADVITIDHWKGSPEHERDPETARMLPSLHDTFLAMNWDHRQRIIPLRMDVGEGLRRVADYGLQPDVIFVDADHSPESVKQQLQLAARLFPQAVLVGDDYDDPGVQQAVDEFAAEQNAQAELAGTGWRAWRLKCPSQRRARPIHELTSIIIVTHNELGFTKECIDSIRARTHEPYEFVFVDNGSSDGTADYLRAIRGATVIANAENRGFPAAVNQGIGVARGENIVLLNNDTVVTTSWLRRLLDVLHSEPRIGLAGPCSNCVSGEQMVAVSYRQMGSLDGFAWEWGKRHAGVVHETDRLIGFCLAMKRALIDEIGLLDERFGIGCFEDDDLCVRARRAGWKAVIARDAFVHHYGSRTFQGSGIDLEKVLAENREKFDAKWQTESVPAAQRIGMNQSTDPIIDQTKPPAGPRRPRFIAERPVDGGGLRLKPNDVRLSLCMIVRDNESTIGPCLESIRPWVDEIVVVDTGSKDRTPEICRQHGARLFEFGWCDDFSAARNESLKYARGEWIFWMDSDDTISESCGRGLKELAAGTHTENILGYILQVHCPGPDEGGYRDVTAVDHVKLIRNRPELRFEGRIHEQLLPSIRRAGGEVAWTDLYVVHSGSDHSPEGWQRKLDRDLRILHSELAERPDHPFVLFNLGMTYADAKRYDEAIGYLEACLRVSRPEESHLRKAYALLVSSLSQSGQHETASTACRRGLSLFPDDKELLFRSGILHHHFGRLAEAEAAYRRVITDPVDRYFVSIDQGLTGYKARHNLALVYDDMARFDWSEREWRHIVAEVPDYPAGWRGLGDCLVRQGKLAEVKELGNMLAARNDALAREAMVLRGRLAATEGDLMTATKELRGADSLRPEDSEPLRILCRLLFERGDPAAAEAALSELTVRAPEDAAAHHNLGTIRQRLWRHKEAIAAYRESLRLRPDSAVTYVQLGRALLQDGNADQAAEAWRNGLKIDPHNVDARTLLSSV